MESAIEVSPRELSIGQRVGVAAWRSAVWALTAVLSRRAKVTATVVSDQPYGPHRDQRLDILEPASGAVHEPAVVFIHGGGWVCGKKETYVQPLNDLANQGYRVFTLEYPLAPEHPHPHILRSLFDALAWINRQHGEHSAVHLVGDSAGGNLAMMLAILIANPSLRPAIDERPYTGPAIASVTSMYGVMDRKTWIEDKFPSARLFMNSYVGPAGLQPEVPDELAITPMDYRLIEHLPPTFIAVGDKDKLARSSAVAAERFQREFDHVDYKIYPGASHGFYTQGAQRDELQADVASFITRHTPDSARIRH